MSAHDSEILAAALPRLTLRQRRAVEAVAAGRRVALPLSEGEILDIAERISNGRDAGGIYSYYALLDALAAMQPAQLSASRQDMEDALQGAWEREARP